MEIKQLLFPWKSQQQQNCTIAAATLAKPTATTLIKT